MIFLWRSTATSGSGHRGLGILREWKFVKAGRFSGHP